MPQDQSRAATLLNKLRVSRRWVLIAAGHTLLSLRALQPVLRK